jgi:hypothetical protein
MFLSAFLFGCCIDCFSDAAASCDLFLFLSGGNVNVGDGNVIVEPPSDSLDAVPAPRHCVALNYLCVLLPPVVKSQLTPPQVSHKFIICPIQRVFQSLPLEGRTF